MVNTEPSGVFEVSEVYYNILNIVVNTELILRWHGKVENYNILNIVVNTEPHNLSNTTCFDYNILNIVVNTERKR